MDKITEELSRLFEHELAAKQISVFSYDHQIFCLNFKLDRALNQLSFANEFYLYAQQNTPFNPLYLQIIKGSIAHTKKNLEFLSDRFHHACRDLYFPSSHSI